MGSSASSGAGVTSVTLVPSRCGQPELLKTAKINLTIDNYNCHWARFRVTGPAQSDVRLSMIRARFVAAFVAPSLAFAGLVVVDDSAHAVTTVSVSVNKNKITVGYNQCKKITVTATGDWASDTFGNMIDVAIYDQRGHWYDGDLFLDDLDGVVTKSFKVCGDDGKSGKWRAVVEVDGYAGAPPYTQTFAEGSDTFKVTQKPRKGSHLSIHKKRVNDGAFKWQVLATLTRAGHPYANQRVYLEADILGWIVLDSAKTTKKGLVGWSFKPNGVRWRFTYEGNNKTKPSISAGFYTRQPGRVVADRVDLHTLRKLVTAG